LPEKIIDFFKGGNIFFNSQEVRIIETSLSANIRVGLEDFMSRLEIPSHKTKDSKSDSKKIQTVDTEILKVEAIVQFVNQNGEYGFIEYPPRHIYFNRSKVFPIADFEKIISGSKVKVTFNKSAAQFFDSEKETEKPKSYAARSVTLSK